MNSTSEDYDSPFAVAAESEGIEHLFFGLTGSTHLTRDPVTGPGRVLKLWLKAHVVEPNILLFYMSFDFCFYLSLMILFIC
jgi:hypothetical protein